MANAIAKIHPRGIIAQVWAGTVVVTTDAWKVALMSPTQGGGWTQDLTMQHYSEVSATELTTAGGYTATGQAITTVTLAPIADETITGWVLNHPTYVGELIRPSAASGYIYRCVATAGDTMTGATEPSPWNSTYQGMLTTDDQVTWECYAKDYVLVFDAAGEVGPSWASATFATNGAVIYDDTDAGKHILASIDFGGTLSPSDGTFSITWAPPADGGICHFGTAF